MLDFDAAVEGPDQGDVRAAAPRHGELVGGHLAAAPGDELRQARIRVRLVAQQHGTTLEHQLEGELGGQLARREGGIAFHGFPSLLEGVEAQELVARRLEQDPVVASLELGLLLEQLDAVRQAARLVLDLAVLAEDADRQRREHREDADDDEDDEDLDQRHAAHGAAARGDAHRPETSGLHWRFQLQMSASVSSPPGSPSAPIEHRS